jgi:ribosome-associated toxin RatA of RatAB toxin-antitoxin module
MAERTQSDIVINAVPARIMDAIADLPSYPEWTEEAKEGEVISVYGDTGRVKQGRLVVDTGTFREEHVYDYVWNGDREVRWSLVGSQMFRSLDGVYSLAPNGDGTTLVTYTLTVETAIPTVGMVRRKAERVVIGRALAGLKRYVEGEPHED